MANPTAMAILQALGMNVEKVTGLTLEFEPSGVIHVTVKRLIVSSEFGSGVATAFETKSFVEAPTPTPPTVLAEPTPEELARGWRVVPTGGGWFTREELGGIPNPEGLRLK